VNGPARFAPLDTFAHLVILRRPSLANSKEFRGPEFHIDGDADDCALVRMNHLYMVKNVHRIAKRQPSSFANANATSLAIVDQLLAEATGVCAGHGGSGGI
jgi:hypothetical protein